MADSAFTDVVQKSGVEDAELEAEEKRIASLEAELNLAQSRIDLAEIRYQNACRQAAAELARPEETKKPEMTADDGLPEMEAKLPSDNIAGPERSAGTKNTSARTDKEMSSERWLANRASEGRVRDKAKKARQCLRRGQRDKRMVFSEAPPDGLEEAPAPTPAKPEAEPAKGNPLWDSDEVKQGAKGIADRLPCLMDRPNVVEKRAALLTVLIGGRENYFIADPSEVLLDLKQRGLVEPGLAGLLLEVLKVDEKPRATPVPPEEWLAHAQKVSGLERKDDKPFNESEGMYLKWVDRKNLTTAEAELDASERKLEELLQQVNACIPGANEDAAAAKKAPTAEQQIDLDYAQYLEEQHDTERQSKGLKNTSALSEKVVSKEKWLAARGIENRGKEKEKMAREARRGEARDSKLAAADAPNDS